MNSLVGSTSITIAIVFLVMASLLIIALKMIRWPGWIAVPLILLVLAAVRDVSLGVFAREWLNKGYQTTVVTVAYSDEIPTAQIVNIIGYLALAAGMLLAAWQTRRQSTRIGRVEWSSGLSHNRAWNIALVLFIIGVASNLYVLSELLRTRSLLSIISDRAVFYDESVIYTPVFNYARLLSRITDVCAWGLVLLSGKKGARRFIGLVSVGVALVVQILFAGRLNTLVTLIGFALVWHYGVQKFKRRAIVAMVLAAVAAVAALVVIQVLREGKTQAEDAFGAVIEDTLLSRSIDETAFAVRLFPAAVSYIGGGPVIEGLIQSFPTADVPDARDTWAYMVDRFFQGFNPSAGVGGEHYSFIPEHYMYFGMEGMLVLNIIFGWAWGRLFAWEKHNRHSLLALLFTIAVTTAFVGSLIDGRMSARFGILPIANLLPLGVIAVLGQKQRHVRGLVLGSVYACIIFFVLNRVLDTRVFDYPFAFALLVGYLASAKAIAAFGLGNSQAANRSLQTVVEGLPVSH